MSLKVREDEKAMRKSALKAVFTIFTLNQADGKRVAWDRIVIVFSTAVTIALIALYVLGKFTARW